MHRDLVQQFAATLQLDKRDCCLQQDGATCHIDNETTKMLRDLFGSRLVSKNIWSPRSLEFIPASHFFLSSHLTERAYRDNHCTLNDLKKAISQAKRNITPAMLKRMSRNMISASKIRVGTFNTCYVPHQYRPTYLLTYLLHGAESFLRS